MGNKRAGVNSDSSLGGLCSELERHGGLRGGGRKSLPGEALAGTSAEAQQGGTRSDPCVPNFLASHCWRGKGAVNPEKQGVQSRRWATVCASHLSPGAGGGGQSGGAPWPCGLTSVPSSPSQPGSSLWVNNPPPHPCCRPAAPTQQEALPLGDPGFEK